MTTSATRSVKLSVIIDGDYRLEASTYLREGYGLSKLAKQAPWLYFSWETCRYLATKQIDGLLDARWTRVAFLHCWTDV